MSLLEKSRAELVLRASLQSLAGGRGTFKILLQAPDKVLFQPDSSREKIPHDALLFGFVTFDDNFTPENLLSKQDDLAAMAGAISQTACARPEWVAAGQTPVAPRE